MSVDGAAAAPSAEEGKKAKKAGGAKKPKAPKAPKDPAAKAAKAAKGARAKNYTEENLLDGISKPATRRLFKLVPNSKGLRLADNATDSIRALIGMTTKRLMHAAAEAVATQQRQTLYLSDCKSTVQTMLPHVSVFG
jgi:histone H3/H4